MSASENTRLLRLEEVENARLLLDQWTQGLAEVLKSMADQKPEVRWQAVSGPFPETAAPGTPPGAESEILWWEQPFQTAPETAVWVGAPRASWEYAGTLVLKAAGLETVALDEAKNTWLEVLGQSLGVMARSIGSFLGREVACLAGRENAPSPNVEEWASVSLTFTEIPLAPLLAVFSPKFLATISVPDPEGTAESASGPGAEPHGDARAPGPETPDASHVALRSRTLELLLDVDLPVSISFGKAELPMRDVLKLTTGSIVELNCGANEPVEVLVNHCPIARGEVVVVEGNYGVRIQQIISRQERIRSLR
ncbi:MAG: FliM/FliN family flagellar motor switch protein [Bryobacteraceae bacterium]|jgi:flagellar motor switch protein FliN/FliY